MRVLLTTDTIGGVWTYTIELARALAADGVESIVAAMGRRVSADQMNEVTTVPGLRLFESELRLPWMDEPWADVEAAGDWLLGIAREVEPDVVHLNEPVYAALPWDLPTIAVGHSCVLSWWEAVHGEPAPPEWERYQLAMRAGLTAATLVVAPSRFMQLALRRHYAVLRSCLIPNGRDAERFRPGVKEPVVVGAGRLWDPAKNVAALEQVADFLPWPIHVAGDTKHPDRQESVAGRAIHFLGPVSGDAMAEWLARAAIYAHPARYEPFGLSVLEAALAECALVLGDIASLRELWDGVAVFVDPDDPEALQAALEGLVADAQLRQMLAMRARRRALGLTPRRMAQAYLAAYTQAAKARATCVS